MFATFSKSVQQGAASLFGGDASQGASQSGAKRNSQRRSVRADGRASDATPLTLNKTVAGENFQKPTINLNRGQSFQSHDSDSHYGRLAQPPAQLRPEEEFEGDKLGYVVHKVFVRYASVRHEGDGPTLDVHQITFLSIAMCDEMGLTVQKRPEWTQVIIGLFHQHDKNNDDVLNEDEAISLVESALEYFGVPLPGAFTVDVEAKKQAAALRQLTERHSVGEVKLKVHEFFQRYAILGQDGLYLTIGELGFLSIMLAGEIGVNAGQYKDWVSIVTELARAADADNLGALDEGQVTDLIESVLQHYGIKTDGGQGRLGRKGALKLLDKQRGQQPRPKAAAKTMLKTAARRGSSRLEVESSNGFSVGDQVIVGNRDQQRIASLSPFVLSGPLQFDHAAGTQVSPMKAAGPNPDPHQGVLPLKDVHHEFEIKQKLGAGGQGTVYLATEIGTGYTRVVKYYSKQNAPAPPSEDAKAEFLTLQSLDHPKIQRLFDVFEDTDNVYVVGEAYTGGDLTKLTDNAQKAGVNVSPIYLLRVMRQVLEGVKYLHRHLIEHCDLKEQNVMVARDDQWNDPRIVVIDFGLSRHFKDMHMQGGGTPGYIPPEVWRDPLAWSAKGDVHSLGVIMYQMYGAPRRPYNGDTIVEIKRATMEDAVDFSPVDNFTALPELLSEMLDKDPENRPSVAHCMESNFFVRDPGMSGHEPLPEDVFNAMINVGQQDDFRRAILEDIAGRVNLAELSELSDTFMRIDTNNDGYVSHDELHASLTADGHDPVKVDGIVQQMCQLGSNNGKIPYSTFMGLMLAAKDSDEHSLLRQEFLKLDVNGDGWIDNEELEVLLERPHLDAVLGTRNVQQLMARMDVDHDGRISWDEFRSVLKGDKDPNRQAREKRKGHTGTRRKYLGVHKDGDDAPKTVLPNGSVARTSPDRSSVAQVGVSHASSRRAEAGQTMPARPQQSMPPSAGAGQTMPARPQQSMPPSLGPKRLTLDEARIGPVRGQHAATMAPGAQGRGAIGQSIARPATSASQPVGGAPFSQRVSAASSPAFGQPVGGAPVSQRVPAANSPAIGQSIARPATSSTQPVGVPLANSPAIGQSIARGYTPSAVQSGAAARVGPVSMPAQNAQAPVSFGQRPAMTQTSMPVQHPQSAASNPLLGSTPAGQPRQLGLSMPVGQMVR